MLPNVDLTDEKRLEDNIKRIKAFKFMENLDNVSEIELIAYIG